MNVNRKIGIEQNLKDELLDNYCFKHELKDCIKEHFKKNINPKDGIKTSTHKTCIGEITILENTKDKEILILKSDKIKSRLSVPADKRQTQDNT